MTRPADQSILDLTEVWPERLARVRRCQARIDVRGMTRPPRDPVKRAFLKRTGQEGPFIESPGEPPEYPPRSTPQGP